MNPTAIKNRTGAFTLIELLTVIAIIGILAALLLPVYNKSEERAKTVWCGNNLTQVGVAFHAFSNDHGGKFPMTVSTNDGGSLEDVQNGFAIGQGHYFYTAYRNFQALSGELVKPELLHCPADVERITATNFPSFQNTNLSYFIGINATFDKPESVLAGDRNLAICNQCQPPGTIMKIGLTYPFEWYPTLRNNPVHNNQGNFLYSDGHVIVEGNPAIWHEVGDRGPDQTLFMPDVEVVNYDPGSSGGGGGSGSSGGSSSDTSGGGSGSTGQSGDSSGNSGSTGQASTSSSGSSSGTAGQSGAPASQPAQSQGMSSSQNKPLYALRTDSESSPTTGKAPTTPTASSDVNDPTVFPGAGTEPGMSTFDSHLMKSLQHTFEWLYLLLLLLVLIYLTYKYRKWVQRKLAKLRVKKDT